LKPLKDHLERGKELLRQKKHDLAENEFLEAAASYPTQASPPYLLGLTCFQTGRLEEALAHFQNAHALNPDDVTTLNNIGLIQFKLNKFVQAEEAFLKAMGIDPNYPEVLYNLGSLFYDQQRRAQAFFMAERCLRIDATHEAAQKLLKRCHDQKGLQQIGQTYKRILIVMEEGIGNMVMLTPTLKAVKEALPGSTLTVFGRQPSIQIIQDWDIVDAIITEPDEETYDICFLTVWSDRFWNSHQAWVRDHCREFIKFGMEKEQHEADHYFRIAQSLGYRGKLPHPHCQARDVDLDVPSGKELVALSDTTLNKGAWERKRWPYYPDLARRLIDQGYSVVLIGGEGEARRFQKDDWPDEVINALGKYDVQETAGLLRRCALFVGNDSGPAHMAAAFNIKTYVFFGPTLVSKNRPLGPKVNVINTNLECSPCQYTPRWESCTDWRCMKEMTVDRVLPIVLGQVRVKSPRVSFPDDAGGEWKLISKDYSRCRLIKEDNQIYIVRDGVKERFRIHLVGAGKANYPWGMENEIVRAMKLMGIDVVETDYRIEREGFAEKFMRPAHLMLVCKGSGISPKLISAYPGRTLLWYQDDVFSTQHAPRDLAHNGRAFDTVYSFDKSALEAYKKFGITDVRYLPLAMSPAVHRKMHVEKQHDVAFVGNIHPNRKPFFERLQKRFDVQVTRAFMDEMVRIFNEARIVLNLGIGPTGIQQRVFEALGCGAFLLTNAIPEADRLFQDKKHLVYFTDETIEASIAYYLEHETEREAIAQSGYVEAHAKHTFRHRIDRIISETIGVEKNGAAGKERITLKERDNTDRVQKEIKKAGTSPRHAVVVVNIGRDRTWDVCRPSVEAYCEKYGLDLKVITEAQFHIQGLPDYNYRTFEKNQVYPFFDAYDRILRLDSDILITPQCPDLFALVPQEAIGVVFEDVGSRKTHRRKMIKNVQEELGDVGWQEGYFNSGMVVASRQHREIFRLSPEDIRLIQSKHLGEMKEQTFLNWRVRKQGIKIHELDYRFNHMSMFSEDWNGSSDPTTSYILHYAGVQKTKVAKIKADVQKIWGSESVASAVHASPCAVVHG